jgi:uncharacterized protein
LENNFRFGNTISKTKIKKRRESMKNLNRREFITRSVTGIGSLGLINLINNPVIAANLQEKTDKIIYRKLGKTDIEIPVVSMGVMNAFFPELIKKSYEVGMRLFDTAANYGDGKSETGLAKAIKELNVRKNVIIATKALYADLRRGLNQKQTKERFLEIFKGSLKRLEMKYVDILYLHDCNNADDVNNPGVLEAMKQLKKEKKIRYAGISSHRGTPEVLNAAVKLGFHDVAEISYNFAYAGFTELNDAIKKAGESGIGLIAMKTQGGGGWWRDMNKYQKIKGELNQTAALKWVLNNKYITSAIPGYTNYDQLNENFSVASNLEYNDEEKSFLEKQKPDMGMNFCRQCSVCVSSCPHKSDIPTLMRTHMYAAQYRNFYHAKATLNGIPSEYGLNACKQCSECSAKCPNSFDISGRINELKTIYA